MELKYQHSNNDFFRELSYIPKYFSYPFGQYGANFSKIVKDLNYQLAFGQHSGVIDTSKNLFELPRWERRHGHQVKKDPALLGERS